VYDWQPWHLHVSLVFKCGSINILENSGPAHASNGIAVTYRYTKRYKYFSFSSVYGSAWARTQAALLHYSSENTSKERRCNSFWKMISCRYKISRVYLYLYCLSVLSGQVHDKYKTLQNSMFALHQVWPTHKMRTTLDVFPYAITLLLTPCNGTTVV